MPNAETIPLELTDQERQLVEDQEWALWDPQVRQQYGDRVVVVHQKRVVGAGRNLHEALDDARTKHGEQCPPRHQLAVAVIEGGPPVADAEPSSPARREDGAG